MKHNLNPPGGSMKRLLKKLFVSLAPFFLPLIFLANVQASNLYTLNFSAAEPPTNWAISDTTNGAAAVSVSFTAQSGTGYMALTATTGTGDKSVHWVYSAVAGKSWGDYTSSFTLVQAISDTNTAFDFGVRAYNPSLGSCSYYGFSYNNTGGAAGAWQVTPKGCASSTPISLTFTAGDIIELSVSGFPATLTLSQNGTTRDTETGTSTSAYASCYAGTILFGLHRTINGVSFARISNLEVIGANYASPTSTVTYTLTPTPTSTLTLTPTPDYSATPTSTYTATPTATPTNTKTSTSTKTSTLTATYTSTRTIKPTFTATPVVWQTVQTHQLITSSAYTLIPQSDQYYSWYSITERAAANKIRMLDDADVLAGNTYTAATTDYTLMPAAGWTGTRRHAKGIYLEADSGSDTVDAQFFKGTQKYPWVK